MTKLRHLRTSRNLLLKDVAKALRTHPGNLCRIEAGTQDPKPPLARRIAAYYGISMDQVFANRKGSGDKIQNLDSTVQERHQSNCGVPPTLKMPALVLEPSSVVALAADRRRSERRREDRRCDEDRSGGGDRRDDHDRRKTSASDAT
jgi:transcriptional regulator with XRE-family HTH domain